MTKEQEEKLNDIHACLVGNKLKGQRGLIDRVDVCENEIDSLKKKKANKFDWTRIFTLGIKFSKTATKVGGM